MDEIKTHLKNTRLPMPDRFGAHQHTGLMFFIRTAALAFLCGLGIVTLSNSAWAKDDIGDYPIAEAMALEQAKEKLGNDVAFYFGDQKHGKVIANYGEVGTNRKTNSFNKSAKEACDWAFISAMLALKNRALEEGGNAVIEIKSNYRDQESSDENNFKCGVGHIMSGVAFKGTIVKLAK